MRSTLLDGSVISNGQKKKEIIYDRVFFFFSFYLIKMADWRRELIVKKKERKVKKTKNKTKRSIARNPQTIRRNDNSF